MFPLPVILLPIMELPTIQKLTSRQEHPCPLLLLQLSAAILSLAGQAQDAQVLTDGSLFQ